MTASRIAELLHKPRAVAELASELSLGEESLLFIDDNPAECAAVRAALPHVPCWCWPQQHAEARVQLQHVWLLDLVGRAAPSAEDQQRADAHAHAAPRAALRASARSLGAYIEALQARAPSRWACRCPHPDLRLDLRLAGARALRRAVRRGGGGA